MCIRDRTKEAEQKILDYYMKMRNVEAEEMITVTPRQLEGLIRLATARARLLMKNQVDGDDAQRAIDLLQSMFEDAGIDVNTGKVDLGVLQGRPRSEVSKMQLFMDVMKIEEIVGDIILVVLDNYEPLKKIGIENDKFFVRVKGYDEYGLWIYQPQFSIPKINNNKKTGTQKVEASILIPWGFIVSVAHFPGAEGFDFPSPFDSHIGFN